MKNSQHRYKICVSGAAAGPSINKSRKQAELIGSEIAKRGAILTSGATTGLPYYAAVGAKKAGGMVFGFSPATTEGEHVRKYRLPLQYMDVITYTGSGYAGRNLILTRSSDAVIVVGGRIGTLNEFTVAFEDKKVIGILENSGGITGELRDILRVAKKGGPEIIFNPDPKTLVSKVISAITREKRHKHLPRIKED